MKIVIWMEEQLGGRKGLVLDSNSGSFELHSAGEDHPISKLKIIATSKENLLSFITKKHLRLTCFMSESAVYSEMPWSTRVHTHTHTHTQSQENDRV